MSQTISITSLSRNIRSPLKKAGKYHYIISISLLVVGVAFTTYYINDILNNPVTSTVNLEQVGFSDTFDTKTIDAIKNFKYSQETTVKPLPAGRTNPFAE